MEQLANFLAISTLNMPGDLNSSATVLTLVTIASPFPSSYPYRIRIDDELMKVTGTPGSNQLTVVRADGGTTAVGHLNGATVRVLLTKESLDSIVSIQSNGSEISNRRIINFSTDFTVADNSGSSRADIGYAGFKVLATDTFNFTVAGSSQSLSIALASYSLTKTMANMVIAVRIMQPNGSNTYSDGDPNYTATECWMVGEAAFGRTDLAATGVPDTLRLHLAKVISVGTTGYKVIGVWHLLG